MSSKSAKDRRAEPNYSIQQSFEDSAGQSDSCSWAVCVSLDPNYQQVANRLRVSIPTKGLPTGDKLPSQHELASQYGVARMTIQQALRDEGLIVTRQESGAFVKGRMERWIDLRPRLQEAFTAHDVTIDFCGLTAETPAGAVVEPLDRIRSRKFHPRSLSIRILLPDSTQ